MQYEITGLVPALAPDSTRGEWWQKRGMLDEFNADDDDEAIARFDKDPDNVYGRLGWRLVATRRGDCGGTALWERLY